MLHSYRVLSADGQSKFWYSHELKDIADRFATEIGGRVEIAPIETERRVWQFLDTRRSGAQT